MLNRGTKRKYVPNVRDSLIEDQSDENRDAMLNDLRFDHSLERNGEKY